MRFGGVRVLLGEAMKEDAELLKEFCELASDEAFAGIVGRHLDLAIFGLTQERQRDKSYLRLDLRIAFGRTSPLWDQEYRLAVRVVRALENGYLSQKRLPRLWRNMSVHL